jgi:hypothetical protein
VIIEAAKRNLEREQISRDNGREDEPKLFDV